MMHEGVWCCEHKSKCKWQGFALHKGLAWGSPELSLPEWREWHEKQCGGNLIQLLPASAAAPESEGLDLEAIEARANAATPGPWISKYGLNVVSPDKRGICCNSHSSNIDGETHQLENHANIEFIAHARADIPALLAEIRRLRAGAEGGGKP